MSSTDTHWWFLRETATNNKLNFILKTTPKKIEKIVVAKHLNLQGTETLALHNLNFQAAF